MSFIARWDAGKCPICLLEILKGDDTRADGGPWKHERCAEGEDERTLVRWEVSAESIDRSDREDLEERRIAPLGKQGKCPRCFIELPATGVCDEHGKVNA